MGTLPKLRGKTPGARIKEAYENAGYNRSTFQRAIGMAYSTILDWERDRYAPRYENLQLIEELTGHSPSEVMDEEGSTVTEPQYEAWRQFLETDEGRSMSRNERATLASIHFVGVKPSVGRYRAILFGLRGAA